MAGRIRVLDDTLIDQIAAGEVVERPASAVKELIENALDAGAHNVTVEVDGGGVKRIRVSDDGCGMTAEEAPLALLRHATSKIRRAADLQDLHTLGFRGEALPSIAAVSRFTLTTRTPAVVSATRVRSEGGAAPAIEAVGAAAGTSVEVKDLFFNVPARRKFLKSLATESAHIADVCLRVALGEPTLRLSLLRGGTAAREWLPAPDRSARARAVFSSQSLSEIATERDGVRVLAVLGSPDRARTGAGALHLFVNGRPVRDRALARAVSFAYGSVLPPGRYPTGVVYLELDPAEVDVNVHPRKTEVRLSRGRGVLDAVTRALASGLGTSAWGGPAARGASFWRARLEDPQGGVRPAAGSHPALADEDHAAATPPPAGAAADERDPWGIAPALREQTERYSEDGATTGQRSQQALLVAHTGRYGSMRVLGQVHRMLIVCEAEDALHVLDQHAADERLRFNRLRHAYERGKVSTQRLLFPVRVDVTDAEAALVEERRAEIAALGLDCAAVGRRSVAVHAIPSIVRRARPERLMHDVLDELQRGGDRAFGDAVDTALATMACHGAIRAGDALSLEECAALLAALDEVGDFAGHCPHGRPVVFSVPLAEIERRLGR